MEYNNELIANESSSSLSSSSSSDITTLKLGEVTVLDELGPIIINSDGTTTRISNWSTMTQQEKGIIIIIIINFNLLLLYVQILLLD
jgi:hypothetical protein